MLRGLGVSFLFMGWSMTGLGLIRREMRFRALSVISICAYVVGYLVVGVGLALLGAGVWSLVAATVTSTLIQAVWQFAILRHPLRPVLRWRPYQTVCGYGTRLQVAHVRTTSGGTSTPSPSPASPARPCSANTAGPTTWCSNRWATTCPRR